MPLFSSSYTGFVNNDINTILSGPVYTVSPNFKGLAGKYTITPSALNLANPNNYIINYIPGTLYVNPRGHHAEDIKASLLCIEKLSNSPSGFPYVAHFAYTNLNNTVLYIPNGTDNYLTGGKFSGQPPVLFTPGTGKFDVYFDGSNITWVIKSYDESIKLTNTSTASSKSKICTTPMTASARTAVQNMVVTDEKTVQTALYPNPVKNRVTVAIANETISEKEIVLIDISGKTHSPVSIKRLSPGSVELDVSNIHEGVYWIRVKTGSSFRIFQMLKIK